MKSCPSESKQPKRPNRTSRADDGDDFAPCQSVNLLTLTAAQRLQKGLVVMDRNALGYLTDLNRNVEGALNLLERLAEYPELNNEDFIIYQSYFREYLADTNMVVLDALAESEQETMLKANRERVSYEKKIRDPDDCYLDVKNREEELRAQDLPSQLGILWGMRRVTTEDIPSSSFEDEDEAGTESDSDQGR
jgi:hypothetical protein